MFNRLAHNIKKSLLKLRDEAVSILGMSAEKNRLLSLQSCLNHSHGPMQIALEPDEAIVLCVVKNSESLAQAFIEHYLQLGFKHIFFLDNGSTDQTIEVIKSYEQTTLISSSQPFSEYYVTFKNFLIQTFGQGKWCLVADIDEFLHFPLNGCLRDVLTYSNQRSFSAVAVQMLDMFSKEGITLSERRSLWTLESLKSVFCYYDLSDIDRKKYVRRFQIQAYSGLNFLYGGIRKTVFGRDCFLTKEALFFAQANTRMRSSHLLKQSRIADFSAVFLHYKFTENFYASTLEAVTQENHWRKSYEYKAYLTVLNQAIPSAKASGQANGVFSLFQPSSRSLTDIDKLIDLNFICVSDEFRAFSATSNAAP